MTRILLAHIDMGMIEQVFRQKSRFWLQSTGIVGFVMLASMLISQAPYRYFRLFPILIVCVLALILIIRVPQIGLLSLVGASFLSPYALGTGTGTGVSSVVLLLSLLIGLQILTRLVQKKPLIDYLPGAYKPIIVFTIIAILSFGMGQIPWLTFGQNAPLFAQLGGLAIFILSFAAFILVGSQTYELRWLKWLVVLFFGLGSIVILGFFIPSLSLLSLRFILPGATGSLFWVWVVALTFSISLSNTRMNLFFRMGLLGLGLASIYILIIEMQSWASGWIPAMVAVVVVVLCVAPRFGLIAALIATSLITLNVQFFNSIVMVDDNAYSLMTRLEAWRLIGEIVKINPILGLGPANYYWNTPLFPILGYSVVFNSHNNYIDIIAQTGFLGLGCFVWFLWEVGSLGWRLRHRVPEGFAKAYVIGCLGGLAGMAVAAMLGDWVIPFVYNVGMDGFRSSIFGWLFLGGLVSLENIYVRNVGSLGIPFRGEDKVKIE